MSNMSTLNNQSDTIQYFERSHFPSGGSHWIRFWVSFISVRKDHWIWQQCEKLGMGFHVLYCTARKNCSTWIYRHFLLYRAHFIEWPYSELLHIRCRSTFTPTCRNAFKIQIALKTECKVFSCNKWFKMLLFDISVEGQTNKNF